MRDIITEAREWAEKLHADQVYGEVPYMTHIQDVVDRVNLALFSENPYPHVGDAIVAAAYMHDAVEDQGVTVDELDDRLGFSASDMVRLVTDPPGFSFREERKRALYANFLRTNRSTAIRFGAAIVKCADRWANQNQCISDRNVHKMVMYSQEFPKFFSVFGVTYTEHDGITALNTELMEQYASMRAFLTNPSNLPLRSFD